MNTVRPRCFGTSQSVRAKHRPQSDHHAPVVQIFEPLSTHSSPSRTAVVCAPGDVGSAARLGEELHPDLLALQNGGDVRELLFVVPNSRSTVAHGWNVGTWMRAGYS